MFFAKNVVFYDVFVKKSTFKGTFIRKNYVFSSLWYPYGTLMVPLWYHKGTIRMKKRHFFDEKNEKNTFTRTFIRKKRVFSSLWYPYGTAAAFVHAVLVP